MSVNLKDEVVLQLDTEPKILCTNEPGHYYFVEFFVKRRVPVRVFCIEKEATKDWYWTTEIDSFRLPSNGPFDKEHLALQDIKKTFYRDLTE